MAIGWMGLVRLASLWLFAVARHTQPEAIHRWERRWARAVRWLLGVELDIEGTHHIEPARSYVVVALHEGLFDPVALYHLQLPLRFLVRDELYEWPDLGRYLRATGQIRVEEEPSRASLRRLVRGARDALARSESLVVFPQGSVLGIEVAFAAGAFRLARMLGRQLLPVVITGSHRVWEHPYSPTIRRGVRVSVRVLEAVEPDIGPDELRELERRMKRIALQPGLAPARRFVPERDGWWDGYRYDIDPDFDALADRVRAHRGGEPYRGSLHPTEEPG